VPFAVRAVAFPGEGGFFAATLSSAGRPAHPIFTLMGPHGARLRRSDGAFEGKDGMRHT
jgi:hypothetical protein